MRSGLLRVFLWVSVGIKIVVSEHTDNLRCGKPEVESGDEKMRMLIRSEEVQRLMRDYI